LIRKIVVCGLFTLAAHTQLHAQTQSDTTAILSTIQKFFTGMEQHDSAAVRATLLPGTRFVSLAAGAPNAKPRFQPDTAFIAMVATTKQHLLERMWSPTVRINGPMATVWTPYDFHVDGKWSHCGVDAFTLVRTETGWIISDLAYTTQRTGCPPSPLGTPAPKK
jgi:hypothetical protein